MIRFSISRLWPRLTEKPSQPRTVFNSTRQKVLIILAFAFIFSNLLKAQSSDSVVTLLFTGDVTLANHFQSYVGKNYSYPFARAPWLRTADVAVINLEGPLTTATEAVSKPYVFKALPDYARMLKAGGIDLADLANNHIFDYGVPGLVQTMEALQKAGIRYVGAGRNSNEAHRPVIFTVKGLKIGFLAYYGVKAHEESHPATDSTAGTALRRLKRIRRDVQALRPKVDFLTVLLHWGFEKEHEPRSFQIRFAHRVISYGVDLIVGHHPHVLQGVEKYKQGLVVYSLGNFIFGGNHRVHYQTAVLKVTIPTRKPKDWSIRFLPLQVDYWQPHLLRNALADSVLSHIAEYSKIFEKTVPIR